MTDDGPSIGGPEGGQTASRRKQLPPWMPALPVDFELTEREIAIAEIAAYKNAAILRKVIIAMAVVVAIGGGGTTLGWYLADNESERRAAAIQQSRLDVLTESCMETNRRSRQTLAQLELLYAQRGASLSERQRRSLQSTRLLIDALAPYRGDRRLKGAAAQVTEMKACRAYARRRLGR